jgi:hypothetical protein
MPHEGLTPEAKTKRRERERERERATRQFSRGRGQQRSAACVESSIESSGFKEKMAVSRLPDGEKMAVDTGTRAGHRWGREETLQQRRNGMERGSGDQDRSRSRKR